MSNENKEVLNKIDESNTTLLFDVFVQLMSLQKLLINKNILTKEELQSANNKETALLLKPLLQKVGISEEEVEKILETLIINKA